MSARRAAVIVFLLALAVAVPAAGAAPGLLVGVTDDAFLWRGDAAVAAATGLGLSAVRVTVPWSPGQSELGAADTARLGPLVAAARAGLRVVVTVFGKAAAAPGDDESRNTYCAFVRDLLARYPIVNDVVIWNEPNLGFYWQPQFTPAGASAAPAAYEQLLARCWDVLHAFRPGVNILMTTSPSGNDDPSAASNVSHSPGAFIRKMGAAYRASGRTKPIFDTVGHNPYGINSAESPWQQHFNPSHIGEADLDRLLNALDDGFGGTAQPVPGHCTGAGSSCVSVWYLETGYQTIIDPLHQSAYTGRENDAHPIPATGRPAPTQSSQLAEGIELAYCQPYVGAIFNFLLWDETDLARWQSGVFWADGSPKDSLAALQQATSEVSKGAIDCRRLRAAHAAPSQPTTDPLVERIEWEPTSVYSAFNDIWRFAIEVRANVSYRASLARLHGCARPASAHCSLILAGRLRSRQPKLLQFPRERLAPGVYRIQITLTRARPTPLTVIRRSSPFAVR